MIDAETRRAIREEIKQQLNIILNAAAGTNDSETETISTLFPGGPDIVKRPMMHPFGFVSRATTGTISVVAKVGSDIQNRMTLGHRDSKRPTDLKVGEAFMYSLGGFQVRAQNDMIIAGKVDGYQVRVTDNTVITGKLAGYQFQVKDTVILAGKGSILEPVIMGTTAVEFFTSLIQLIVEHTHLGNLGIETSPTLNAPQFIELQAENLDNNFILAEDGGRF